MFHAKNIEHAIQNTVRLNIVDAEKRRTKSGGWA